jgi:hypothetical protein
MKEFTKYLKKMFKQTDDLILKSNTIKDTFLKPENACKYNKKYQPNLSVIEPINEPIVKPKVLSSPKSKVKITILH